MNTGAWQNSELQCVSMQWVFLRIMLLKLFVPIVHQPVIIMFSHSSVYITVCVCVCLLYPSSDHFPWLYYKFCKWDNFPSSSHYSYWSVCMHVCVVSHTDEQMSRWKTSLQYQWAIQLSTWEFFQWAISHSPHLSVLQSTNHWQISLSIKHIKQVPPNTIPIYTQIIQNEAKSTKPTSKGHRINSSKPSKNHIIHREII